MLLTAGTSHLYSYARKIRKSSVIQFNLPDEQKELWKCVLSADPGSEPLPAVGKFGNRCLKVYSRVTGL